MNDQTLVKGLSEGSEQAYREVFVRYFEPLCFFANKYLNDLDASRDLVQELMSYLYENRDKIAINESLKSFLYRSVANRSLNLLKHYDVRKRHHEIIRDRSDIHYQDEDIEFSELQARINRLMDDLPTECGRIFRMSRVDQLSNQEIADKLNISKRTVETQISKALKVFRKALKIMILQFILEKFLL